MIAVDTNILVYAHREDAQWHDMAYGRLTELAKGRTPWAIPWPCLHEFLAIESVYADGPWVVRWLVRAEIRLGVDLFKTSSS